MIETKELPAFLHSAKKDHGVFLLSDPDTAFEENYIRLRKKEGWLYADEEVKQIPEIKTADAEHAKIWKLRKDSADRFLAYCKTKNKPLKFLEIGCGNGWFSAKIAANNPACSVIGTDINFYELKQASRVFHLENLHFVLADVFNSPFPENEFDFIVFNGSVQYFPELKRILEKAKSLLNANGEIHILDSPFYANENDAAEAKERTAAYYLKMEAPEMAESYSHHLLKTLEACGAELLYKPEKKSLLERISGKTKHPFVWAKISKQP